MMFMRALFAILEIFNHLSSEYIRRKYIRNGRNQEMERMQRLQNERIRKAKDAGRIAVDSSNKRLHKDPYQRD